MNLEILDAPKSILGEGIFIDSERDVLYWVDIIQGEIYQYCLIEKRLINSFSVGNDPSCILSVREKKIIYVDKIGIKSLCVTTGDVVEINKHPVHCANKSRANDGVVLSDGSVLYGTMHYNPECEPGSIYHLNVNGEYIVHDINVHIPNTFVEVEDFILISDSFKKRIERVRLNDKNIDSQVVWKDFSMFDFTPDGGFLSERGFVHIALWDGSSVIVMDKNGEVVHTISLPVLRPTNCALHNDRWLYVTSAYEGMTEEQLNAYPLSGQTLVVDLGHNYEY